MGFSLRRALLIFMALPASLAWARPPVQVYGYLQNWTGIDATKLDWDGLTTVMDAFAVPQPNSQLQVTPNTGLISAAHAHGARVYLSIGGQFGGSNFSSDTASGPAIAGFVASITNSVQAWGYDGVDIDWEPAPWGPGEGSHPDLEPQVMAFMSALYPAVKAMGPAVDGQPRGVTFFLASAGYDICGEDWSTLGDDCDAVILSGYAFNVVAGVHNYNGPLSGGPGYTNCAGGSTTVDIQGTYDQVTARGFPASKLVLGCPLYGDVYNAGSNSYPATETDNQVLLTPGPTPVLYGSPEDEQVFGNLPGYAGDEISIDTGQAFCDKMAWVMSKGMEGIALWDVSQAFPPDSGSGPYSVSAIWQSIQTGCLPATPTPTFSASPTVSPTFTISPTFTVSPTPTAAPPEAGKVELWPVPFHPSRGEVLHFGRVAAGARATVYNLVGQEVYERTLSGDWRTDVWNGWNGDGQDAATGVYFVVVSGDPTVYRVALLRN